MFAWRNNYISYNGAGGGPGTVEYLIVGGGAGGGGYTGGWSGRRVCFP